MTPFGYVPLGMELNRLRYWSETSSDRVSILKCETKIDTET